MLAMTGEQEYVKRTHFIAGVFSLSSSDPKIISFIIEHENVILNFMMRKRSSGSVRVIRDNLTSEFIGTFKVDKFIYIH